MSNRQRLLSFSLDKNPEPTSEHLCPSNWRKVAKSTPCTARSNEIKNQSISHLHRQHPVSHTSTDIQHCNPIAPYRETDWDRPPPPPDTSRSTLEASPPAHAPAGQAGGTAAVLREHVTLRPQVGWLGCHERGPVVQEVAFSAEGTLRLRLRGQDVLQHRTQLLGRRLAGATRPLLVTTCGVTQMGQADCGLRSISVELVI